MNALTISSGGLSCWSKPLPPCTSSTLVHSGRGLDPGHTTPGAPPMQTITTYPSVELSQSRISGEIALMQTDERDMITHLQWLTDYQAAAYLQDGASLLDNHLASDHILDDPQPYQTADWRTLKLERLP